MHQRPGLSGPVATLVGSLGVIILLARNVSPLLFVALFVVLNLKEYQYAETIYDMTIMPLFLRYKLVLQQSASQLEEAISQQTNKLHKGVQESFQQSKKSIIQSWPGSAIICSTTL